MSFYKHKNGIDFRKLEDTDLLTLKSLKDESWFGTVNTACVNFHDQQRWFEKISFDASKIFFIGSINVKIPDPRVCLFGITDINAINQSCEFTHSVFDCFRGKGYGKQTLEAGIDMAFEVFGMRRIETWILENNHAEISCVKHLGFREEGRKRAAVYKCGEYLDCILYGLLRNEWAASSRVQSFGSICNKSYIPKCQKP